MKVSSTRRVHVYSNREGSGYVTIEHAAQAESRITLKDIDVTLRNIRAHAGRHGLDETCQHRFPAGSVITHIGDSEVIVDGTHAMLSNVPFTDRADSHAHERVVWQHANTGGTIDAIRRDVLDFSESNWSYSLLAGIHGRELALATAGIGVRPESDVPDLVPDLVPALVPGDQISWYSPDVYRGVNLPPTAEEVTPASWTSGVC